MSEIGRQRASIGQNRGPSLYWVSYLAFSCCLLASSAHFSPTYSWVAASGPALLLCSAAHCIFQLSHQETEPVSYILRPSNASLTPVAFVNSCRQPAADPPPAALH